MFEPPRCPNEACAMHAAPEGRFYIRRGHYRAQCRPHPIPRFRCRTCGRNFSRQTFRHDYRDIKPHLNARVIEWLCSGVGVTETPPTISATHQTFDHY